MRKSLIVLGMLSVAVSYAQTGRVGINTENPNATLEVAGVPTNTRVLDGIIAPKITGNQLKAKTYTTSQTGALVYVTEAASTANKTGQTINIAGAGYYYFDGSVWQTFKAGDTNNGYLAGSGMLLSGNTFSRTGLERTDTGGYRLVGSGGTVGKNAIDMNTVSTSTSNGAKGEGAVTIGASNTASGRYSLAVGESNSVSGEYSIALGNKNVGTVSDGSIAMGVNNQIHSSKYSVAIGNENYIDLSYYSVLMGYKHQVRSTASLVVGSGNVISTSKIIGPSHNFISGSQNKLSDASFSTILGASNIINASADYSLVAGRENTSNAGNSFVVGYKNINNGSASVVMGSNNTVHANNSLAGGIENIASGIASVALGSGHFVGNYGEVAIGYRNFNTDESAQDSNNFSQNEKQLFALGNGRSSNSRSNALVVLRNGKTGIGIAPDIGKPANSKPTEMLDVNGNVRVRGAKTTITEGATCTNAGTITFGTDGNFYGCAGTTTLTWKKLHN